ncbi:hypothetical protein [Thermospira aquatica]|uniref:Lipoprotein n=1 Tax=Thermospira aquatica TaxID=2828656 RepID=A0AAX3BDJ3_9SPIR|nr:hypothetical protein [Thermospira aquatica]URA10394.1 hypothetical protein KDW03_00905 [Thermospira aquatica]
MKRMIWFSFFALSVLGACQRLTKENIIKVNGNTISSSVFGPVVMTEDRFFRSLSVVYKTLLPQTTYLNFTMTGDIDWYLERPFSNTFHHVIFEDVEEEASYTFLPRFFPSNAMTTVVTPPFDKKKNFSFAIVRMGSVWTHSARPAFTVLVDTRAEVTEEEFRGFCIQNHILSHFSILCPTFSVRFSERIFGTSDSWYWFSYGRAIVILLKNTMPRESLYLYLSQKEEDENFIIAQDFSEKEWEKLQLYDKVAHLIPFTAETESLIIDLSIKPVKMLYSYKK